MENDMQALFAMTELERLLKQILQQRPDIRSHILTAQELTDYISWMAKEFRRPNNITAESLPIRPLTPQMIDLAKRLLADPMDDQALSTLSTGYSRQSEDRYLITDYDISVSRMLRYMPSHWHTNSYFEIYYAFSGTCPIHFQDEIIELKPGTVLIVAPSAAHASPCYHDDSVLVYYMLRSSTFEQVFWNQLPSDSLMASFFQRALSGQHSASYIQFETGGDEQIHRLLYQIYQEYHQESPYKAQLLNALMSTFFILLLRGYEGTARLPRSEDFFWKHEFSAILSHIQSNYASVTREDLAQRYHYSVRQISRIVQDCTGMSYHELILKLRMEKAAKLLRQANISMEAVAYAVGYSTVSSFYRAFVSYYGKPPKQYLEETS